VSLCAGKSPAAQGSLSPLGVLDVTLQHTPWRVSCVDLAGDLALRRLNAVLPPRVQASEQGNHELLLCRHWWRRRLGCYVRTPCCARCLPRCLCYPLALLFFRQSSMGLCGGRRAVRLSFAVRHRSYWIVWGRHVFVGPRRFHHHVVPSARPSSPSGVQMVNVSPSRVDPELSAP
jgi:hypothetical protein